MNTFLSWFTRAAHGASRTAGRPSVFIAAAFIVLIWATTGPFFGLSDTWQLAITTSTTAFTFLLLFLIQAARSCDTDALQITRNDEELSRRIRTRVKRDKGVSVVLGVKIGGSQKTVRKKSGGK